MGLESFTDDDEETQSSNQSTYVTYKNPRNAEISEGSEHRHQQEYYDAIQELRSKMGQDLNVPIGEFAAAAVEAEEGDSSRLEELFQKLSN